MATTSGTPAFSEEYIRADKGPKILAIIIVFPTLALITVALRLYTRIRIVHNPSWEDYAILAALVVYTYQIGESTLTLFRFSALPHRYVRALVSCIPPSSCN